MFDPAYHDTEALIARVAPDVLAHTELNQVSAVVQREIQASEALEQYALKLWGATREPATYGIQIEGANMQALILAGASPRGMSMLLRAARVAAWLKGRSFVAPEDIQFVYHETIAHRVFFNPVYELRRSQVSKDLMQGILNHIAAP
jgi:MoxR-like ATPase